MFSTSRQIIKYPRNKRLYLVALIEDVQYTKLPKGSNQTKRQQSTLSLMLVSIKIDHKIKR